MGVGLIQSLEAVVADGDGALVPGFSGPAGARARPVVGPSLGIVAPAHYDGPPLDPAPGDGTPTVSRATASSVASSSPSEVGRKRWLAR